jgi:hypothetical protein
MRLSLERDKEREDDDDTSNTISTSPKDDAYKYSHKSDSKIYLFTVYHRTEKLVQYKPSYCKTSLGGLGAWRHIHFFPFRCFHNDYSVIVNNRCSFANETLHVVQFVQNKICQIIHITFQL